MSEPDSPYAFLDIRLIGSVLPSALLALCLFVLPIALPDQNVRCLSIALRKFRIRALEVEAKKPCQFKPLTEVFRTLFFEASSTPEEGVTSFRAQVVLILRFGN